MSKDIFTQLKKLRTEPRAGYVGEERRARGRDQLMAAITSSRQAKAAWAPTVAFEYVRFSFSDLLAKPVTAFASFVVLIFGSLTTASAASQSLPGDTLYSVKLVSERAQLSLASADRRAVLHTEFAENRLQEIMDLTSTGAADRVLVATAVDAFKREVAYATQEIQNLQTTGNQGLIAQVSVVNDKFTALNTSIGQAPVEHAPGLTTSTVTASETVVDTVVDVYENEPEPTSATELKKLFQARMNALIQRRTLSIGRIEVIEANAEFSEVTSRRETAVLRGRISLVSEEMSDANGFAGASGYRAAFERLREAEVFMRAIESELSAIEFKLIESNTEPATDIPTPITPVAPTAQESSKPSEAQAQ